MRRLTMVLVAAATTVVLLVPGAVATAARPPGSLDPTFGNGGLVLLHPPGSGFIPYTTIAAQPDGKIVVVGTNEVAFRTFRMNIERYRTDGSLDDGFGDHGRVDPGIQSTGGLPLEVAVQPDGRIVVAGGLDGEIDVVRLLPDGSLDPSFGAGGVVAPLGGRLGAQLEAADSLAVAPDGTVYLASQRSSNGHLVVVRLRPDGSIDTSYGPPRAGGFVELAATSDGTTEPSGIALDRSGRLVVAGLDTEPTAGFVGTILVRLATDGSFDRSYGFGGVAISPFVPNGLSLTKDGSALLTGFRLTSLDAFVQRFTPRGRPDLAFGTGSIADLKIDGGGLGLVQQPHGAIVVFGNAQRGQNAALFHLTPAGRPDPTFGVGGLVVTSFGPQSSSIAVAAAAVPSGKVVALVNVVGSAGFPQLLARYH
jgi:uncharacterized delta-60 repeat protein